MSTTAQPKYDILLFGVTGFTGKLAAEYLMEKDYRGTTGLQWAVSARNEARAKAALEVIAAPFSASLPDILVADLVCESEADTEKLRAVVRQTKVVLTCSGPFEKYSQTLVSLCAELGVYYADITGESDYFRQTIQKHDQTAQQTGAVIICHCGNDCIPADLLVWELHQKAKAKGCELQKVMVYNEGSEEAAFSGGTASTAAFQLSKKRDKSSSTTFDPLLTASSGEKSEFATKNICPKGEIDVPTLPGRKAGPWIMGPVMMNCVRRSNALLGYSKKLEYGDSYVKKESWSAWIRDTGMATAIAGAIYAPSLFGGLLPQAGEGPPREHMERGFLKVHAEATMLPVGEDSPTPQRITGIFEFRKDTAYLYTAAMLVETGMLLVEQHGTLAGGCKSPAAALGGALTQRILAQMDTSLEIHQA